MANLSICNLKFVIHGTGGWERGLIKPDIQLVNFIHHFCTIILDQFERNVMNEIQTNPKILGGTPVFKGTRVPVETLFDYLEEGASIETFIKDYPTVKKEQAVAVLEIAGKVVSSQDFKSKYEAAS